MLLLDFEGSGASGTALDLEGQLSEQLRPVWGEFARAIVIEPELDVWMWGSDGTLHEVLEWRGEGTLRDWLRTKKFSFDENEKPNPPKEAMEAALRHLKTPMSSALYGRLAGRIGLERCSDPAFGRLRDQMRRWFPT